MKLLEEYERACRLSKKWNEKKELLRRQLEEGCVHPAKHVRDYEWEHDNGYGRQSMIKGKRCDLCYGIDSYNTGRFFRPRNDDE